MTAEQTPLERQQLELIDASAHTFWHWVRFDIVTAVAEAQGATQIADIGAGSGMLGDRLADTHPAFTYRFDELSPALDAALASRWGQSARLNDDERLGVDTVAAMLDVIEHIENDVEALGAWHDRMDSGAHLVVTVPALQWGFSQWDTDLGHYRRYSRTSLRAALESSGFEVERCDYLFPELLPLLVKRKLSSASGGDADMPVLSDRINRVGHLLSGATSRLRKVWPAGTSVVAVARRR
ncbi:MAG: methyltransferase domain-containing protein [Ilumatobacter sp.]